MVDIYNMKSRVRWTFFLLSTFSFICLVGLVSVTLSAFGIQLDSITSSIYGGIVAGVILILFDIIVIQGIEYEDNRRDKRVKDMVKGAMSTPQVREVIRQEVSNALEEKIK